VGGKTRLKRGEREEESAGERYGVGGGERGRKELRYREIEVEREVGKN